MPIAFNPVGTFDGVDGGPQVLNNPTSLQFGPDGRLYVSEQNGDINAFTVSIQGGQYVATDHELLTLPGGVDGVVKSIQNHNDDGTEASQSNRQVTGLVVTGTAENPVLYISSSDPRIAANGEVNLDTNSGVVTRATWTGTEWDVVDIVRGLPRSEENHATNGLAIDPNDATKLYLMVGGNTNNGAPSSFFSYTGEYALSGALLEIDLTDIEFRPILTDPDGGQNGARQYIYDLPTLDDPNTPNVTDGVGEDANGLDEDGPWGGNDGLNMAILPADAPLRIYADGFRNAYDIAFTSDGRLYTVDNGSNGNLGANPNTEAGDADGDGVSNEAISTPNNGGSGDPEPLFLIQDGGYYGHANPVRSNQNQSWTSYDNGGNPDGTLTQNTVTDISAQVPNGLNIEAGFIIDPSKFTGDPARLAESGERVERSSAETNAITTVGSSTNGIVVYDSGGAAFDGALDGQLFVTQFNDNITLLNLNEAGDALTPVLEEGPDGIFGTADDVVQSGGADGILEVANNSLGVPLANPLDVTVGPNGTLWIAEIGGNEITVLAPSDIILPGDNDSDDDGLLNAVDPFLRDATNGTSVTITPETPTVWEFSQDAGDITPGPDGFGGGLTGHMIDGTTDFEEFLQSPSARPGQVIQLDNVKFVTAAAGGTTTIEEVQNGDPFQAGNSGQFFFHTGFQLAANVETFTVQWVVANPGAIVGGSDITNNFQQIGGYIGDGTQSNYLKIVAIATNNPATGTPPTAGIQVTLEEADGVAQSFTLPANAIFDDADLVPDSLITFELEIDPVAATALPRATFQTTTGEVVITGGTADVIDLTGSQVLETILGNNTVNGQSTGIAAGLFATNNGSGTDTFQAVFDSITVTATEAQVAPDAVDDEAFTGIDTALVIPVAQLLANDTDANPADTLTVIGVGNAQNGAVSLGAGVVTFTPTLGYEGPASFDYTVSDGTFTDTATVSVSVADRVILYRVNAGGPELAALDSGPVWEADTGAANSPYLINPGNNNTAGFAAVDPGPAIPAEVPGALFDTERWDAPASPEMQWGFAVTPGQYEVNLFLGNGFSGTSAPGARVFDVEIEGTVLPNLDDIDLSGQFGHQVGGVISNTVQVTDGQLNIEFLHDVAENPLVNGIEIVQVGTSVAPQTPEVNILNAVQSVPETGQAFISIATDITVPNDETVDVNFTIEATGGATPGPGPGGDYEYTSASAVFGGGTYTDTKSIAGGSSDLQIPVSILEDAAIDPNEGFVLTINSVSPNATLGPNSVATVTIEDDETATGGTVIARINSGGPEVAATDGGPVWSADQNPNPTPFLVAGGPNTFATNTTINTSTVTTAPAEIFNNERWDPLEVDPDPQLEMQYEFTGLVPGSYTVNLYIVEGSSAQSVIGGRSFDVAVEGAVPTVFDNIAPFDTFGNDAFVLSHTQQVTDGTLDLDFIHDGANNPAIRGIEIIQNGTSEPADTVDGVPVADNDFSSDAGVPTTVELAADGTTTVVSNLEGGHNDRDFITVTIPEGQRLVDIVLDGYVADPGNSGFLGLKLGSDFVVDPAIPGPGITPDGVVEPGDLEGGYVFNEGDVGTDLLPKLNAPSFGFVGFDEENLTGDVTVWLNQGGDASQATLTFVTEAIPTSNLVAAVNVGGPALNQDGIDFAADAFFVNGTVFTDNNGGNGQQPVFDDTVFETERFGGASGSAPLGFEIPVGPGEYNVELYFAEIFQAPDSFGARVFDVSIEGQLVLDDFDILVETGGDINQSVVINVPEAFSPDTFGNPDALDIDIAALADNGKISGIVVRSAEPDPTGGAATLTVNNGANGIETSNFGNGSFVITNTGTKDIGYIEIDVTDALFPDAVFDPFGEAGDLTGKIFTLNGGSDGGTGLVVPAGGFDEDAIGITYIGDGGSDGFEKLRLEFTDFNPGDSISFGVDMDPNSIAGAVKDTLDSGAPLQGAGGNNIWDVGGIGGAELSGSTFAVGYTDGSTSVGQLQGQGTGSQLGAEALSSQDSPDLAVTLTVNGLDEGAEGTYSDGGPQVLIQGPDGETARVLVAKGFIVPFTNEFPDTADPNEYHDQLDAQLAALEASGFPANNAVEMLYVDVMLDGTVQDISTLFDFTQVAAFDLSVPDQTNEFGVLDEAQLPLGITAAVVDLATDQPKGPVTSPIHLTFAENSAPAIQPIGDITLDEGQEAAFSVTSTDANSDPITLSVVVTRDIDSSVVDPSEYSFTDNGDGTAAFSWLTDEPDEGVYTATVTADDGASQTTEALAIVVNEVAEPAQTVLYRVNAGGAEVAAADGGPVWTADTQANNSPFLVNPGSNNDFPTNGQPNLSVDISALAGTGAVAEMIGIERWDNTNDANGEMAWAFDVAAGTEVQVNLYVAELFTGLPDLNGNGNPSGDRVFDVSVDGTVPAAFNDIDPYSLAGGAFNKGAVVSTTVISDGTIDLEFIHDSENTAVKGIEIIALNPTDSEAPVGTLSAADVTAAGADHEFTVTFTDNSGIDVSTLDGADITVSNDAIGFSANASLVSIDVAADGTPRTATYSIAAPGGSFDAADNGSYTVSLNADQVDDIVGNAVLATNLGTFEVAVPTAAAGALIEITPDSGIGASTFSGSSFQITNISETGVAITSVSIDLSTGILPDMVFDPTGSGGDATASPFTPNSGALATGLVVPGDPAVDPFSQPRNGGFDVITIDFTDFDPSEQFLFTTDVDPNSIQAVSGAGAAGAVSGYELIGGTVTVNFSNGETLTGSLFEDGSLGGAQTIVQSDPVPMAPSIEVLGAGADESSLPGTQVTVSEDPTIRVSGAEGENVALLQMDSRLFIASGAPPFDVSQNELPFYANEAMSGKVIYTGVIGAGGFVDIPVSLLETDGGTTPDGGLNQFIAVTSTSPYMVDEATSRTSNVLTVKQSAPIIYDEPGVMTFDGTTASVVELAPDPAWQVPAGTVAFSFNAGDTNGDQGLFAKDASFFGGGGHATIYLDGNTLIARFQDQSTSAELSFSGISAGTEYEIAATFGPDGVELWVDGNLVDSDALPVSWAGNAEYVQWGGRGWGSSSGAPGFDAPFNGTISDKQVYGGVLDASQIAALAAFSSATNNPPDVIDDAFATDEDVAVDIPVAVLLANDSDPDGDIPVFVGLATQPANGSVVDNGDGSLTYTPQPDFNGSDSFSVTIGDGIGGTAESAVNLTVNPVNDDPQAVDDLADTILNSPVVIPVLDNDVDVDGDVLVVTGVTDASNGTAVENADGTITFTPNTDFIGSGSFTYTIGDQAGGVPSTATVNVTVLAAPNTPPVAVNDGESGDEDTVISGNVLANDSDGNADPLTAALVDDVANGTLALNDDGTFDYTPDADFNGTDSFTYVANDGVDDSDPATVTITVNPVNDAPIANDDSASAAQGQSVIINLVGNDDDVDGDALAIFNLSATSEGGSVVGNGNGTVTYTSAADFEGTETFTYLAGDGEAVSAAPATVSIDVSAFPTPIFDAPAPETFNGTAGTVIQLPHNPVLAIPAGTVNFAFTAADTNGAQGLFVKDASGFGGGGNHLAIYLQGSTLVARFQNGEGGGNSVSLQVPGISAGIEYDLAATFGPEGSKVYLDGTEVASTPLVMNWTTNVEFIQWGGRGWGSASGTPGFDAPFEGQIADRQIYDVALDADQIVDLHTDGPPNNDPFAVDDAITVDEDASVTFDPAGNDTDLDGDTVVAASIASAPANGLAVVNGDGTVTYTPDPNFAGTDSFGVQVSDGNGGSDVSETSVTVNEIEDDPVANDDTASVQVDSSVLIDVLANDSDGDGDPLSVLLAGAAGNGSVTILPDNTVAYTPDPGFTGEDSFEYEVSDGAGPTDMATVTVTVSAEPLLPEPVFERSGVTGFNGTTGAVQNIDPTSSEGSVLALTEGTVAFSFIDNDTSVRQGLVVKDASFFGGGGHFATYIDSGNLVFRFQDGDSSETFVVPVANGVEYEVAATFGSGGVAAYVDGSLVGEAAGFDADWATNAEWLQIGGLGWGSSSGGASFTNPYSGQIADVEIYDEILDEDLVTQLAEESSFDGSIA